MTRLSANLGFLWPDRPLLERIAAAADAGFEAVELHWPYDVPAEAVRAACEAWNLRLLGINAPVGARPGDFGLGALAGREADFMASLEEAAAYAEASGASAVHVLAGVVDPARRAEGREVLVRNLRRAASRSPGLTLLIEPINQRDKPGYFYSTQEEAAAVIAEVGAPNLRLMFDVYHVGVSQGDVLTRLERFLPLVGHVQIAAVPSRAEPDEGEIAYGAVFEALERLGYPGFVGCEYRPRGDTAAGLGWRDRLGLRPAAKGRTTC